MASKIFWEDVEGIDEFHEALNYPGLVCAELYVDWAGPCKAIISLFRSINIQNFGRNLKFVRVPVQKIPYLKKWHASCIPKYLFIRGGVLVEEIIGNRSVDLVRAFEEHMPEEGETVDVVPFDPEEAWHEAEPDMPLSPPRTAPRADDADDDGADDGDADDGEPSSQAGADE